MSVLAVINNPIVGSLIISVFVQGAILLYKYIESKHPKIAADIAKDAALLEAHKSFLSALVPIVQAITAKIPAVAKVEAELKPLAPLAAQVVADAKKDTATATVTVVAPVENKALGIVEEVARAAANVA
jgi:hypothetical protein